MPSRSIGKNCERLTAFILLGTVSRVKFLSGDHGAFFLARLFRAGIRGPVRACRIPEI
jgi:hypothetical protein